MVLLRQRLYTSKIHHNIPKQKKEEKKKKKKRKGKYEIINRLKQTIHLLHGYIKLELLYLKIITR